MKYEKKTKPALWLAAAKLKPRQPKPRRIASATPQMQARRRKYLKLSRAWLAEPEQQFCMVSLIVPEVPVQRASQCHHRRGRLLTKQGDLLLLESEWCQVSMAGHLWIENNKSLARELNLLAPVGEFNTWPEGVPSNL